MLKLFQSKIFRKKIAILLCLSLVFNSIFLPVSVSADETSPPENSEQQQSPPPETSSDPQPQSDPPPPTETPAPTNEIQTGDANSQATSDTTVNYTESTTSGNVSADGCSVDVDIDCNPSTTNDAQVSGETSASSTSGVNDITTAEGSAPIDSGDAVSQSTAQNLLNTNIVEATQEAEIDSGSLSAETSRDKQAGMTEIEMANSANLQD